MRASTRSLISMWLSSGVCFALLNGCPSTTTVDPVSLEGGPHGPVGKTLVIAVAPANEVALALENEWVRQLKARGVDALALSALAPGEPRPDRVRVVEVAKANAIESVLVSRIVERKKVQDEVSVAGSPASAMPGYYGNYANFYDRSLSANSSSTYTVERQAAVVQTNLYDAKSEKLYWSARSDTLLVGSAGELIHGYVEAIIKAMAKSKIF